MAKLVSDPKPKRVDCNRCFATIEYLPEDIVIVPPGNDGWGDWVPAIHKVKCPREKCPGDGIIK